ncbi:MAG: type I secretion system permease/ATPase [Devosia sp.]
MPAPAQNPLNDAIRASRSYLLAAFGFSLAINLLYLASPLYMLQVYNRVVTSGSQITLVLLTVILLVALGALAVLDGVRTRILTRMGLRLDRLLADSVLAASFRAPPGDARPRALRDFDTVRQFVGSGSLSSLLDLPWVPLYIAAAFLLHPLIGWFTLSGATILLCLAIVNELLLSSAMRDVGEAAQKGHAYAEMSLRNAEVVEAMGMLPGIIARWRRDRNRFLARQSETADRSLAMGGLIKFLRLAMQSLVLGLGAWLAVERLVSAGAMFAGTFLLGRALQPIEQIVGSWRNIVAARSAYMRVHDLLALAPKDGDRMGLPRPMGAVSVEGLRYAAPRTTRYILRDVNFSLHAGEALGIIGQSGAGKSTLLRVLVGVLPPSTGAVRLDGAELQSWPRQQLGRHIGYLPQDVELFADTIAANISRFTRGPESEIIAAAEMAGVHEMILRLPDGYNTEVGEGGAVLSGGYRQRIGLARAVFGNPSLVVLDEPSSNLDADGETALGDCIARLKALGTTVVMVSHRPATVATMDRLLVMRDGAVDGFGLREEITNRLQQAAARPARPEPKVAHG